MCTARKATIQLHYPEAFAHEALETRPPDQIIGKLLTGEHSQSCSSAIGDHLRSIIDRQRSVLCDGLHHHVHHHLQPTDQLLLLRPLLRTDRDDLCARLIQLHQQPPDLTITYRFDAPAISRIPPSCPGRNVIKRNLFASIQLSPGRGDPADHFIPGVSEWIPPLTETTPPS